MHQQKKIALEIAAKITRVNGPIVKRLKSKKSQRTKKFKMAKSGIEFVLYFSITTLGRKTTIKEDKKTIKATVAMVGFTSQLLWKV
jgi:Cft2 family RNA processing exonuclease